MKANRHDRAHLARGFESYTRPENHPASSRHQEPYPRWWPQLATDNPVQIAAWAEAFPGCNWGLAMGPSGLAAIDIDGAIGEASLFNFEMSQGSLPETLTHKTPRGGRHLIFSDPEHKARNRARNRGQRSIRAAATVLLWSHPPHSKASPTSVLMMQSRRRFPISLLKLSDAQAKSQSSCKYNARRARQRGTRPRLSSKSH